MTPLEQLGVMVGRLLAPAVVLGTWIRRARLFHPLGDVYDGVATSVAKGRLEPLASSLAGPFLARLSGGIWPHARPWPDVLGLALRFHAGVADPPEGSAQDLLLITSRSLGRLPIAVMTTDTSDFYGNTYHAGPPFTVAGVGTAYLRFVPNDRCAGSGDRRVRLARAVREGRARGTLEVRLRGETSWAPLVALALTAPSRVDQDALAFSPFRAGRGLHPSGFVHSLRRRPYPAAHAARGAR